MHKLSTIFLITFCLLISGSAYCQTSPSLPEGFYDEQIGDNWERPLGIVFDFQGQGYVWEKQGKVYIIDDEGNKSNTPLIDISEEVMTWSDHGLVGFALHPDFDVNGYMYLYYSVDRHHMDFFGTPEYDPELSIENQATIGRITRYTVDANTSFQSIVPDSRKIILGNDRSDGAPILMGSHAVGSLVFAPDGTLMVSLGDAGSYESIDVGSAPTEESAWEQAIAEGILQEEDNVGALKALQVDNLNGSILRIDPETGYGLPSNPYFNGDVSSPRSKVWASGLRNPYKFIHIPNTGAHDPATGDPGVFFVGDVGGSGWEELNVITEPGQCFGWPIYEGVYANWGFDGLRIENPYYPNPVNCEKEHFTFHDLLENANNLVDPVFVNPCDNGKLITSAPTLVHTPPAVAWSGLMWNPPPKTRIPFYDPITGALDKLPISNEPDAEFKGVEFAGFTSVPGFYYDGEGFPEEYHGKYFHADLSGWIKVFTMDENYHCTAIDSFALWDDKGIVSMTYNPRDDAIYWCHVYSSEVHRITFGQDPRPKAIIEADKNFGTSPLSIQFDASASYDPDGGPLTYFWDFGNGDTSTDVAPIATFLESSGDIKDFTVSLFVTDASDQVDQETYLVSVNNEPPTVSITSFENGSTYSVNGHTWLPLEAVAEDPISNGEIELTWEVFLHHNNHYHPNAPIEAQSSFAFIEPLGCDQETYWYRIRVTASDPSGLTAFDEHEIFPYCGDAFVEVVNLEARIIENNEVKLSWETDFAEDGLRFEVERTPDFKYQTIGTVDQNEDGQYSFIDTDPNADLLYYRIKVIREGDYDYSTIATVDFLDGFQAKFYPNPLSNWTLFVEVLNSPSENLELQLFDQMGRMVYRHFWQPSETNPSSIILQPYELFGNIFHYRIISEENVLKTGVITRL